MLRARTVSPKQDSPNLLRNDWESSVGYKDPRYQIINIWIPSKQHKNLSNKIVDLRKKSKNKTHIRNYTENISGRKSPTKKRMSKSRNSGMHVLKSTTKTKLFNNINKVWERYTPTARLKSKASRQREFQTSTQFDSTLSISRKNVKSSLISSKPTKKSLYKLLKMKIIEEKIKSIEDLDIDVF